MADYKIFGIFREKSHSPDRELDDEIILKLSAERLSSLLKRQIPLLEPDEFLDIAIDFNPKLIFFMCEEEECLDKLSALQKNLNCNLINSVEAVKNTFREPMTRLLEEYEYFPKSQIIASKDINTCKLTPPVWVKRGDYHAIERQDVIFASNEKELISAAASFRKRGIEKIVVQRHVPGDIIKFYLIQDPDTGTTYWFKWFYHKDQDLSEYPFSKTELFEKCQSVGCHLGLHIYGGDAIVNPEGEIFIIDVNAWPSFALFREQASKAIGSLLMDQLSATKGRYRSASTFHGQSSTCQ